MPCRHDEAAREGKAEAPSEEVYCGVFRKLGDGTKMYAHDVVIYEGNEERSIETDCIMHN